MAMVIAMASEYPATCITSFLFEGAAKIGGSKLLPLIVEIIWFSHCLSLPLEG
jgi:hypothetical protein